MLQIEKRETESVFRFLIWCFDIVCVPTFAVGIPYFRPWRNVGASNFVLSASHITLRVMRSGLGSSRFARRYSGNTPPEADLFSFPPGNEMFHFPGLASTHHATRDAI